MKRHQIVGDSTWVCVADKTDEVTIDNAAVVDTQDILKCSKSLQVFLTLLKFLH